MNDNNFNTWLAGFWEGEGCLSKLRRQTGYQVSINQAIDNNRTVESCMKKIQEKFNGHLYNFDIQQRYNPNYKLQMRWQLDKRKDIIYFLKTIYPYCQIRKKDIENVLRHYEINPKRINQYKECVF